MYITKTRSANFFFFRREVNASRQIEEVLMRKTRLTRSGCCKVAMEGFCFYAPPKTMNIKCEKKSEALLRKMVRNNSLYGLVNLILNGAVGVIYASGRKQRFR